MCSPFEYTTFLYTYLIIKKRVDLGLYQDWKTYSNLRFEHRGDLLMGFMLIVGLSQFIPNRIYDLQTNQSIFID
jgi:hypothetical protein